MLLFLILYIFSNFSEKFFKYIHLALICKQAWGTSQKLALSWSSSSALLETWTWIDLRRGLARKYHRCSSSCLQRWLHGFGGCSWMILVFCLRHGLLPAVSSTRSTCWWRWQLQCLGQQAWLTSPFHNFELPGFGSWASWIAFGVHQILAVLHCLILFRK